MSWRRLVKQLAQRAKAHIEAKGMEKSVEDFRKKERLSKTPPDSRKGLKKLMRLKSEVCKWF